jgi:RNA polymerase sigma-70 factor (family 1)
VKILEDNIEKDLLIRLSQGEEPAYNTLYKAYSKPLYLRILRMVKDVDIADDLLQELFIKLWDKRKNLDTEKSFQSYMYTVAQNMMYNHFRKVARDQALTQSLLLNVADHCLSGEELLENKQAAEILKQAIDLLSPQRKQVFHLCKIEGKSYEETSQIMGISTATVNSHMTKSLQSIKEYLLKHQDIAFLLMGVYLISAVNEC